VRDKRPIVKYRIKAQGFMSMERMGDSL